MASLMDLRPSVPQLVTPNATTVLEYVYLCLSTAPSRLLPSLHSRLHQSPNLPSCFSSCFSPIQSPHSSQMIFFFFFKDTFIYFLAVVGLCCCTQAFSNDRKQGLLFIVVWGFSLQWLLLLQSTGSRQAGFGGCSEWALERWLSSWGARA